LRPYGPYCLK